MSQRKVLYVSQFIFPHAIKLLESKCEVLQVINGTKDDVLSKIHDIEGLYWCTKILPLTDDIIAAGPKLKVVSTMSAGYDHIQTDEMKRRGIKFGNLRDVTNGIVADVAVLLALAASRKLREGLIQVESGNWKPGTQSNLGQDIEDSVVGIVGLGNIGQAVLKRLKPFGVKEFLYTGTKENSHGLKLGAKFVSLEKLNKESDFVIACCALNENTNKMFNEQFFKNMKNTAVFVNISRGGVVDQDALINALKNNDIFAAGLDVTTPEPLPKDSELLKLSNCIVLPHIGAATEKAWKKMSMLTAENVLLGLDDLELKTPVTL